MPAFDLRQDADALTDELVAWAAAYALGRCADVDDARFDAFAARLFALQRSGIAPYGRYSAARAALLGAAPGGQTAATSANSPPLLPVTALKSVAAQLPWVASAQHVQFHTSGTVDGAPGTVRLASTRAYDAAVDAGFERALLAPCGVDRPRRVLSLVPDQTLRPHSSLGYMAQRLLQTIDDGGGGQFLRRPVGDGVAFDDQGERAGLDIEGFVAALHAAVNDAIPVVVLATTLAIDLLAAAWPDTVRLRLPAGSRVMDTGGPKGRHHVANRRAQRRWLDERLGVDANCIVGELGMTELASQRYEVAGGTADAPWFAGPPWLRSVVLDSDSLRPVPLGAIGVIGHLDLANIETVAFLLTSDLGALHALDDGRTALELVGRAPGSELRGCGLDIEALLGS
jgi:hypothetical protein